MITISGLSARIAGRLLIDNASLSLPSGTKAGLVGRNGAGKTTLLRAALGLLPHRGRSSLALLAPRKLTLIDADPDLVQIVADLYGRQGAAGKVESR